MSGVPVPLVAAEVAEKVQQRARAEETFRRVMGSFPTGVTVVTAPAEDGPRGMTCSSLTSVCLRPPTLAVCLRTASSTLGAALRQGGFAVNLLHGGAERVARAFSTDVPDRFALVGWRMSEKGLPLLTDDVCAYAQCEVSRTLEAGDHTMVLGTVIDAGVVPGTPLVYAHRSFRPWDALPRTPERPEGGR
ncbi:flavin reductase family protein [Streptomyces sp. NPDC046976]|uniref:flavin reductase family protein n=1 Tax=Streptomyces sp. NPDC046976 TaxID=3155258 RepID=UPI003400D892